jgi:hypothetical protein
MVRKKNKPMKKTLLTLTAALGLTIATHAQDRIFEVPKAYQHGISPLCTTANTDDIITIRLPDTDPEGYSGMIPVEPTPAPTPEVLFDDDWFYVPKAYQFGISPLRTWDAFAAAGSGLVKIPRDPTHPFGTVK